MSTYNFKAIHNGQLKGARSVDVVGNSVEERK